MAATVDRGGRVSSYHDGPTDELTMPLLLTILLIRMLGLQVGPPPDTEIFLASLSVKDRTVTFGAPVNISNSSGYDNQPAFTPDGTAILFTSSRGDRKPDPANPAALGTDIYRYDIGAARLSQVTNTPESEYSPTVTPDGRHISVIRVEADKTQRLWQFLMDGTGPELVLRDVKPVGYHAWAGENTLALFVLGEQGRPASLRVADTRTGKAEIVATGIGRSIQRMPNGQISFVSRAAGPDGAKPVLAVVELNPATRQITPLVSIPLGPNDVETTWTPDGLLLVSIEGQLYGWRKGDAALFQVADLPALGLRSVTRLAVSPKGDRIAIVAVK